jgi:flagellar protein FlgJ
MKPADFIAAVAPVAVQLRLEGSPIFASLRIAQAAHETGWNIHSWNNLVGLKVGSGKPNQYWDGSSVRTGTWEVINGYRVDTTANWRAYRSIEDCFRDQDLLFAGSRYARVREAKTPQEQAEMLYICGYATDPAYAQKLKNLMVMYELEKFDREVLQVQELMIKLEVAEKRIAALEKQLERVPAPAWFVAEFGSADLGGLIHDPKLTAEGWRTLAVALRAQKSM